MAKVGLLTVHGMGETKIGYSENLLKVLKKKVGDDIWDEVETSEVYYQSILQKNEERYFNSVKGRLRWRNMRKFMLYGICDAASLEAYKVGIESPYYKAQDIVLENLKVLYDKLQNYSHLIIIAQSLGGQVVSNFLWDSFGSRHPRFGVWSDNPVFNSDEQEKFCRGVTLARLYTTGCNIPVFVAGHDEENIEPIEVYRTDFEWKNYYDKDDVLGWPLGGLCQKYANLVKDKPVNSGFLDSLTPLSHRNYWTDSDVIKPLAADIKKLVKTSEPNP